MSMSTGTRLGPYEIVAPLGAGGMGEVYRARDTRLHRDVALKMLPVAVAADAGRRGRFELEARATAALNHPNIVAVYDVGSKRSVFHRQRAHRRRDPARRREARPTKGARVGRADRDRTRGRSRRRHRASRSQAREHPGHARRPDQDSRLRPRETRSRTCGRR